MEVGDIVRYNFSSPKSQQKFSVLGVIIFVGDSSIVIDCEDTTKMKVSPKNFNKIELVKHVQEEKENIVVR